MSKPILERVKIGQSGRCADGRHIEPNWLREAAANYSQDVYTALLWPEHMRWGNNWGEVIALEALDEADGEVGLYASFMPNASYTWEKQYDQKLFYSMELNFEIMADGSAYLDGLGVTDSPASLGIRPHRFSRGGRAPLSFSSKIPALGVSREPIRPVGNNEPHWLKSALDRFERLLFSKTNNFSEDYMTKEEIQALIDEAKAELQALIDALTSRVDAIETKAAEAETKAEEAAKTVEASKKSAPGEEFRASFERLEKQLAEMNERFSSAVPGSAAPENTGAAGDDKPLF